MTAHARGADPAAVSFGSSPHPRPPSCGGAAGGRVRWLLLLVNFATAGSAPARQPDSIEGIPVPVPAIDGEIDFSAIGPGSVLADPGGGDDTMPGAAGAVPWDALLGCSDAGAACGPHGCRFPDHGVCPSAGPGGWTDAGGEPCGPDGDCRNGGCRPGTLWAVQADALVLWRNSIDGQPLLAGSNGAVALDAGDVRTTAAAGPRIGVLRSLGCGRAIEANYFNVGGIQGSVATDGMNAPYTPIGLGDIRFAVFDAGEYTTRGQIKSAEFNYRWCQGRRIIWLAGFRWVEWNETGVVDTLPAGTGITTTAGNDLYGGQFGCRLRLWDLGPWHVGAVGKAGGFGNTAFQRTSAVVTGTPVGPLAADATAASFFGEVGVNSTLWLNRWLAWRAGYNLFFIQGVATAPQQFPLVNFGSDTAAIDTAGSVFLQGFSTGLEARW